MSRTLRVTLAAGAATAVVLWTGAAIGAWWLLQAVAGALDGGTAAPAMQAVTEWTERPWVQRWLAPQDAAALRDGVDWLLGLGGGPAVWLGTAVSLLTVALVMVWLGGLVLAVLTGVLAFALLRRTGVWWQNAPWQNARWPSMANLRNWRPGASAAPR